MTPRPTTGERAALPSIVLAWPVGAATGWGLYGLHLAIQLRRLGRQVFLAFPPDLSSVPRTAHALLPDAGDPLPAADEPCIIVSALGNRPTPPPDLSLPGRVYHVALAVFEDTALDDADIAVLRQYDRVIAPSSWCARLLTLHGLPGVPVCYQGYDDAVFHPAPRLRARVETPGWDRRVLVFSGGKLEYRKGQDIVIAAFRRFREMCPGAVLVTAWHNQWPATLDGLWAAGHVRGVPAVRHGALELTPWLARNGVPPEAHLDLGQVSPAEAAAAIRECDVALCLSRAEGATNLVLAECVALGVPCVATRVTGQGEGAAPQVVCVTTPVSAAERPVRLYRGVDGWGEADPSTVADGLARALVEPLQQGRPLSWEDVAPRFSDLLTIPSGVPVRVTPEGDEPSAVA